VDRRRLFLLVRAAAAADSHVNSLGQRIASLIAAQGPMSIAQFMTVALHDPRYGYYATRDPLGADFITAPEISQTFGELIGLWIVQCWYDQGKPASARLVELGPGRGTLMADALRAAKLAPDFLKAISVEMVESSPALREIQMGKLKDAPVSITWSDSFADTADNRPLFLIANEFFDALPIRQFVKTERGWCERMVTTDANGALTFALSPVPANLDIPEKRGVAEIGAVYETSSAASAIVEEISRVIATKGGAALIIDYGYDSDAGFGETFQAVGGNTYQDVLADPGDVDLTAHVDFAALSRAALSVDAAPYGPISQGPFLEFLGTRKRAARLAIANPKQSEEINAAVDRLVDPDKMGGLFKALAIVSGGASPPPGFINAESSSSTEVAEQGMFLLQAENLLAIAEIEHGFFGRRGGVSDGVYKSLNCGPGSGDDRAKVIENRATAVGFVAPNAKLVTVHQIHSATCVTVTEAWELGEGPQADAMVTDQREIALGILTADCAPVLFADAEANVIGAAHAGWKGALGGVTDSTIAAMEKLGTKRSRIIAAVGPCISQANYEVGPEFRKTFLYDDSANARFFIASDKPDHFRFDLEGYVVHRLESAGIGSIEPLSTCTYAGETEFFSFRRTTHRGEADYGREISLIVLI
jgi:NADH dehydrogenase [ubiquinone] 1 alpha subcomplex assembly factor 7